MLPIGIATGTGHWTGGARRALEGQCLAILTYFSYHARLKNFNNFKYLF